MLVAMMKDDLDGSSPLDSTKLNLLNIADPSKKD